MSEHEGRYPEPTHAETGTPEAPAAKLEAMVQRAAYDVGQRPGIWSAGPTQTTVRSVLNAAEVPKLLAENEWLKLWVANNAKENVFIIQHMNMKQKAIRRLVELENERDALRREWVDMEAKRNYAIEVRNRLQQRVDRQANELGVNTKIFAKKNAYIAELEETLAVARFFAEYGGFTEAVQLKAQLESVQ